MFLSTKEKKSMSLTTQIILASVLALVFGTIVGDWTKNIEFIGTIWLRLIQMSIIILIMTSRSRAGAIGNIEGAGAGKMSLHTFKYIIIFTIFSALLGLGLGLIIKPGLGIDLGLTGDVVTEGNELASTSVVDTLVEFVPENIFQAMSEGSTIQAIVFSLIFGVAAASYTKKTGRDNVLLLIKDTNGVIMEIHKYGYEISTNRYLCFVSTSSRRNWI